MTAPDVTFRSSPAAHTEYRVICARPDHRGHCWEFRTLDDAIRFCEMENRHRSTGSSCWPHDIEARFVDSWQPVEL